MTIKSIFSYLCILFLILVKLSLVLNSVIAAIRPKATINLGFMIIGVPKENSFQEKRTATVRSYGSSKIVQVNGDNLRRYLADHPDAGYRLMTHMSHHLARTVTETSNLLKQVLWLI